MSSQDAQAREQIRQLESGLAEWQPVRVLYLLQLRSQVQAYLDGQEALGRELPVERSQIGAIDALLDRHAARIVAAAARQGGLRAARSRMAPTRQEWWWYLDERIAARLRILMTRLSATLIGAILLILLGAYLRGTFFRLDPQEKEALGYATLAEQMLYMGEYEGALERYEQAVAARPDLADGWLSLTVLYEIRGSDIEAQKARARAEELMADPLQFLLALARKYEAVQELDQALLLAVQAVQIEPESAEAHMVRGSILDGQGQRDLALADFELASELARQSGEEALYVLARSRLGVLMQQEDAVPPPVGITP